MNPRTYVARRPEDLIALVPFLLGFHPADSVVLLTFGAPAGSFHARTDLPADDDERESLVTTLCEAVRANGATVTAVVVFGDDHDRARAACARLVPALERSGASVVDAIRADGRSWWSLLRAGGPHSYDTSSHPFTAEQVLEGNAAFRTRDELADSIRGVDTEEQQRISDAADGLASTLLAGGPDRARESARAHAGWLRDRLACAVSQDRALDVPDAARMLLLVQLPQMRDVACARMTRASAGRHVRVWRDLLRRAPRDLVPGAGAMLALAAWLDGSGALAWCAVDRCREVAPDHPLAGHVADLLQHAVPPSTWVPLDEATLPLLADKAS